MLNQYWALAFLLLTSAGEYKPSFPAHQPDEWPLVQKALWDFSISMEIMDEREKSRFFYNPKDFVVDVNLVRQRYSELRDLPRLEEANLLPPLDVIQDMKSFNRRFTRLFRHNSMLDLDRSDFIAEIGADLDYRYKLWDYAADARSSWAYTVTRRQALHNLKSELSKMESLSSLPYQNLPYAVPPSYFVEVK